MNPIDICQILLQAAEISARIDEKWRVVRIIDKVEKILDANIPAETYDNNRDSSK